MCKLRPRAGLTACRTLAGLTTCRTRDGLTAYETLAGLTTCRTRDGLTAYITHAGLRIPTLLSLRTDKPDPKNHIFRPFSRSAEIRPE